MMKEWVLFATGALVMGFVVDLIVGDPHGCLLYTSDAADD